MSLRGRDLISIRDLSTEEIGEILDRAAKMIPVAEGKKQSDLLDGRLVATAFFEPSTRTRLSFETAVQRLGGRCITIADAGHTSMRKGESLSDTVRMLSAYSDAIVIRHPSEGAARMAADLSDRPVVNAGDGSNQHPTQALLDLLAIREAFGTLAGLKVVLLGDLRFGRAAHSLAFALAAVGVEIVLTSPRSLELPEELREDLDATGAKVSEEPELGRAVRDADVLYVTRIQKERFGDEGEYRQVAGSYRVDAAVLDRAKPRLIVLHPLPRAGEIDPEVDRTPHAAYFRQAFLAVPTRMAVLSAILEGKGA
ncbi:MAG: aspartate carbamoyltransferase [Thermoplasmata archaeon]